MILLLATINFWPHWSKEHKSMFISPNNGWKYYHLWVFVGCRWSLVETIFYAFFSPLKKRQTQRAIFLPFNPPMVVVVANNGRWSVIMLLVGCCLLVALALLSQSYCNFWHNNTRTCGRSCVFLSAFVRVSQSVSCPQWTISVVPVLWPCWSSQVQWCQPRYILRHSFLLVRPFI